MPKYTGDETEVRIATTEAGLDSANPLSNVSSVEWNVDQGVKEVPVGLGSRLQEQHETLIVYAGSLEKWQDEVAVAGSANFATAVGAYQQAALTPLYVEVKNKTTGKKVRLKKCKGNYSRPIDSPEGFVMESWDFGYEDISET